MIIFIYYWHSVCPRGIVVCLLYAIWESIELCEMELGKVSGNHSFASGVQRKWILVTFCMLGVGEWILVFHLFLYHWTITILAKSWNSIVFQYSKHWNTPEIHSEDDNNYRTRCYVHICFLWCIWLFWVGGYTPNEMQAFYVWCYW